MKSIVITTLACFLRGHAWREERRNFVRERHRLLVPFDHIQCVVCTRCHRDDTSLRGTWSCIGDIRQSLHEGWCRLVHKDFIPF